LLLLTKGGVIGNGYRQAWADLRKSGIGRVVRESLRGDRSGKCVAAPHTPHKVSYRTASGQGLWAIRYPEEVARTEFDKDYGNRS